MQRRLPQRLQDVRRGPQRTADSHLQLSIQFDTGVSEVDTLFLCVRVSPSMGGLVLMVHGMRLFVRMGYVETVVGCEVSVWYVRCDWDSEAGKF